MEVRYWRLHLQGSHNVWLPLWFSEFVKKVPEGYWCSLYYSPSTLNGQGLAQ